jgi:hypothetical protein
MMNKMKVCSPVVLVIMLACGESAFAQKRASGNQQRIIKEEAIDTVSPGCEFKFTVVEAKGELLPTTRTMLRSMGYGVKGVPEGFGLPVKCNEHNGSGWINQAGELQSFILPVKGWFSERSGDEFKPVSGKLRVITKSVDLEGKEVEATYVHFGGSPLNDYSKRLLNDIGIAIQGTASPILVTLGDGRKLKGTLTPTNLVVVTTEVWKN